MSGICPPTKSDACCENFLRLEAKHRESCELFQQELMHSREEFKNELKAFREESRKEMKEFRESVNTSVQGLLEAWNAGTGLVKFIKWLGGIGFALTATSHMWALIKEHLK